MMDQILPFTLIYKAFVEMDMEINLKAPKTLELLQVLVVGNNPIEMGRILDKLKRIDHRKVVTEIAFDLETIFERLTHFQPNHILIDDNIGKEELTVAVSKLNAHKKTKNVPITVLKNSNYSESAVSSQILDYILKQDISGESLINAIKNSLKFKRTQRYLYTTYHQRKGQLLRLIKR
jgi:DNA-binding NarL/FixJ family response regulator